MIGSFESKKEAQNCLAYTKTKFYRALLFFNRIQKNLSQSTFNLIPIQDFQIEWTDEKLYGKYDLTEEEIAFIETMIRPMGSSND
jgi:site-specific DNA-methyltransferase (adenine-specific)